MRKVDDGEKKEKEKKKKKNVKKEKRKNNAVYSGHKRCCQLTAQMPTNWNATGLCQLLCKITYIEYPFIFPKESKSCEIIFLQKVKQFSFGVVLPLLT